MPTLNWLGKEKVVNHHIDVPFRILEHKYSYELGVMNYELGVENDELKTHNSQLITYSGNKIIHGDNLEALKALLLEYEGRIKCIYIDPPYNTGNEGWVYNDNVNHPKIKKWLGEVVGKQGEDLTRHDKWLCMMYPRLKLLHKLLSDDGAIFISIDDNEQANLKLICDEIFGGNNFVAEMIWQKRKGGGNDSFFMAVDHEYVLCYVKNKSSQNQKWKTVYDEDYLKRYKETDEIGKFYWDTLSRAGLNNPIIYDVECPDGSIIKNGTWQVSKQTFEDGLKNGNIGFIKNKSGGYTVVRKVRMPEGKVFRSILNDVTNKNAADEMETIFGNKKEFSTPKPVDLISQFIQLSTDKDSIILDSFAGSGTTAHAVLNLNKQDGGNRKFILIEMEDYAETITAERVKRVMSYELGVMNDDGQATHNSKLITHNSQSFDFYELGAPLFKDAENLNEEIGEEKIREYIWYTETRESYKLGVMSYKLGVMDDELKTHNSKLTTHNSNNYFLGTHNDTAYYFIYEKESATTLDAGFLASITTKSEQYVIYADNCLLTKEFMQKNNIIFKKIPRQITRF